MRRKFWLVTMLAAMIGLLFSIPVSANQLTFGVQTHLPDSQVDKSVNYFDLKLNPGETETATVTVTNGTKKEVKIKPKVTTATTNLNGVVEYSKTGKTDKSLKYKISDYVKPTQKEIVLKAQESKEITLEFKMPKKQFKGIMAGGLQLQDQNALAKKSTTKSGTSVQNQYAYVIGMVMQQTTKKAAPQMKMGTVKASQENYRNVIKTNLRNVSPTYINKLSVNAKVKNQGGKVVYAQKSTNMQMAPNSIFSFPLRLNGQKLKAGDYTMDIVAKSKGHRWHFAKNFSISADKAQTLNQKDVSIEKDYTWLYITLGFVGLAVIGLFVWWMMHKKLKKQAEENATLRAKIKNENRHE